LSCCSCRCCSVNSLPPAMAAGQMTVAPAAIT
jgi:hypothetical protein